MQARDMPLASRARVYHVVRVCGNTLKENTEASAPLHFAYHAKRWRTRTNMVERCEVRVTHTLDLKTSAYAQRANLHWLFFNTYVSSTKLIYYQFDRVKIMRMYRTEYRLLSRLHHQIIIFCKFIIVKQYYEITMDKSVSNNRILILLILLNSWNTNIVSSMTWHVSSDWWKLVQSC
jgi:hypothetical protein